LAAKAYQWRPPGQLGLSRSCENRALACTGCVSLKNASWAAKPFKGRLLGQLRPTGRGFLGS